MRRGIDLTVAIFWLTLLSPILLLIAALIRIDSLGPIFYASQMIGYHGKAFTLVRFRTMSAQQRTRVGKFLRNYSLDHLPMLINLLKGDLTLVGPRPMEVNIVDLQDPDWQRYFQVRPGLFNYAVLKLGKSWTSARIRYPALNQELEFEYFEKRSLRLDLQLFLRSLRALVISKGNIKARGKPAPDIQDRLRKQFP
jgi:lipopolysaccharide/colanic/teichoic acid biosynthesis glycosyltransferase